MEWWTWVLLMVGPVISGLIVRWISSTQRKAEAAITVPLTEAVAELKRLGSAMEAIRMEMSEIRSDLSLARELAEARLDRLEIDYKDHEGRIRAVEQERP